MNLPDPRPFSRWIALMTLAVGLGACTNFTYPASNAQEEPPTTKDPSMSEMLDQDWIVTPSAISTRMAEAEGRVPLIWDARGAEVNLSESSPAIFAPTWQQFSRQDAPYRGLLLDDPDALSTQLMNHGVHESSQVFVLDDPGNGWGEGGRLVWMLRSIGHEDAHLVLLPEGGELPSGVLDSIEASRASAPETATPAPIVWSEELLATTEEIQSLLDEATPEEVVFIDTREEREYEGETPYGEQRGGHLPGAVHVYFKTLLTPDGALRPEEELLDILSEQGITRDKRIVAYCTGGIRSAWLVVVLRALGFENVENYAGSMWEWSAGEESSHPLEQ